MPKRRVDLRLDEDLVDWIDGYGGRMRWDRTTVIVAALESFREDVGGGVPDVPKPALEEPRASPEPTRPAAPRAPAPEFPGVVRGSEVPAPNYAWERQQKLNKDRGRKR